MLGIELGSTRIKACLIGDELTRPCSRVASHEWENDLRRRPVDLFLERGVVRPPGGLRRPGGERSRKHGVTPTAYGAIGVSAMMHGYLAFDADDELLVPFRTWRNTSTGPLRPPSCPSSSASTSRCAWSIAHLQQAVLDAEPHVPQLRYLTTLAGYVHWKLTGERVLGVGDASGMFPIDPAAPATTTRTCSARFDALGGRPLGAPRAELLPEVLVAGQSAGELTAEGAALLDPDG